MLTQLPLALHEFGSEGEYQLDRGHTLRLGASGAILRGGSNFIEISRKQDQGYPEIVTRAQSECAATVLTCVKEPKASNGNVQINAELMMSSASSTGLMFRAANGFVSEEILGAYLLVRLDYLRYLLKVLLLGRADISIDPIAFQSQAYLHDCIRDGQLTPLMLSNEIRDLESKGIPIKDAFYMATLRNMGEEIRHALFRTGYHLQRLTTMLCDINETETVRDYMREKRCSGIKYDPISYEFSGIITAAYSTLDYLYRFFAFAARRPVGDPARPKSLHFPAGTSSDALKLAGGSRSTDLTVTKAPLAIPNLTPTLFAGLRKSRNDVAHNFGTDDIRPALYVGMPTSPRAQIQYVQYTVRDISPDGGPVTHTWCDQFYHQNRDAQESAYEYLENCWKCVLDTVEWLIVRSRADCEANSVSVLTLVQNSILCEMSG